jgi:hypothetical protein
LFKPDTFEEQTAYLTEMKQRLAKNNSDLKTAQMALEQSEQKLREFQERLQGLANHGKLTASPSAIPRLQELRIKDTQVKVDDVQKRLKSLEDSLSATPEKAIALPLLKQQVTDLQDSTHSELDAVRQEMSRLYGMTQWCLGFVITMALSVFGMALTSLKRGRKEDKIEQ